MEINLTSVQVVKKLGLAITSNTLVQWTHKGFVRGVRADVGKRGSNFEYPEGEVRRVRDAIKAFGAERLPECLAEGYVIPAPKPVKAPKMPKHEGTNGLPFRTAEQPPLPVQYSTEAVQSLAELRGLRSEVAALAEALKAMHATLAEFVAGWK